MKTILLVDDNRYIIEALALTLDNHATGGNILKLKAPNGREGADILSTVRVDLILTDLDMPVMNGYGLIEHRNRLFPHVPVVVATGDVSADVIRRLNAMGVTEWLEKPFDFDAAAQLILKKLARHQDRPDPLPQAAAATVTATV
jgi:two-component system, chemotaxis family, chemotaxis protein CheY